MGHGLQHLGRCDDRLACPAAFLDEFLLDTGKLFKIHFHAHVAASDHDPIGKGQYFPEIFDSLGVFDLGDDLDPFTAILVEKRSEDLDIRSTPHEGSSYIIHIHFNTKQNVLTVRFADVFQIQGLVRDIHTFSVTYLAACNDNAANFFICRIGYPQSHPSVVDQDGRPQAHL